MKVEVIQPKIKNKYELPVGEQTIPDHSTRLSHKLLGNFSATFEIFGNFLEFWQLLEFSATLGFLRFFEATFFTF